ncbi:hypothetical protein [Nitrincola nitratireducens]|uniref:Putative low-complexity protein n=1 Tax=Nitrincola nitratireducens TaxID=1229521 RepID=W9V6L0_9GAMM|nr:hypothetical protein [Nitrincola nitratireducens]EXJ12541.1 putative low-complexity protein [Nitrincola nitratireducens]
MKTTTKTLLSATGAALIGLGMAASASAANPFATEVLTQGYTQVAQYGSTEAKCGEAKCGEAKCGEAKCGEEKIEEAKCGEGKCGG